MTQEIVRRATGEIVDLSTFSDNTWLDPESPTGLCTDNLHTERFWSKVDMSGDCWEWRAARHRSGYGAFEHNHKLVAAHRFSWELFHGSIPDGLVVCHECDNRPCVRDHLFIGSQADNQADMTRKGRGRLGDRNGARTKPERHVRGERTGTAKLSTETVREIRQLYGSKQLSQRGLANRFGVAKSTIGAIVHGQSWAHVESDE